VNRNELEKDLKAFKEISKLSAQDSKEANPRAVKSRTIQEEQEEDDENEFLNVNKWNKQKKSEIQKAYEDEQQRAKNASSK
jgi:hypothetical protein